MLDRFGVLKEVKGSMGAKAAMNVIQVFQKQFDRDAPVAAALFDQEQRYLLASRRWLTEFDLDECSYIGLSHSELWPEVAEKSRAFFLRCVGGEVLSFDFEAARCRSVERRWWRWQVRPWMDSQGRIGGVVIFSEDITAIKVAQDQMRIVDRVFASTGEAIMIANADRRIQAVNAAFTAMTGYSADEAVGQSTSLLKSGRHGPEFYQALWRSIADQGSWQGEIMNRRKSGEIYPEWLTISAIKDEQGGLQHYLAVFSDISRIKEKQREVEFLATHDLLTQLPNRALFQDRLKQSLAHAERKGSRIALVFIDLDNFKSVNDTLGHDTGDLLLTQVAGRLVSLVRGGDTVARLGGDEFTVVLDDVSMDAVTDWTSRVEASLTAPFLVEDRLLYVSASLGVAFFPDDGRVAGDLVKAADAAMYRAKDRGRNRTEFFRAELSAQLQRRVRVERALHVALRTGGFYLVYQPKLDLCADAHPLVGAEALLRWHDAELGDVSPGEFVPIAEAMGLIEKLDRMVCAMALDQLSTWRANGHASPVLAINMSPRSLREASFASGFLGQLATHDLSTASVQIEVTEGALLESGPIVEANLATLVAAGVEISLDDFGTGYSSLSYLKRLNLHELKIDKSFVNGLGEDRDDEAIADAILALAAALGLKTVAEGIETEKQLDWLRRRGCQIGQGYWFHAPLDADSFERLLKSRRV